MVSLSGHCSEITRGYYHRTSSKNVTPETLADMAHMERTPFVLRQFSDWMDDVGADNPLRGTEWTQYNRSTLDPQTRERWESALDAFFRTRSRSEIETEGRRRGINACVLAAGASTTLSREAQTTPDSAAPAAAARSAARARCRFSVPH